MSVRIRAALSVVLLATLLWLLPVEDLVTAVRRISPLWWAGAVGLFLAGHQLGAMKWRLMVNTGRAGLSAYHAVRCYSAGLFANLCLPSIIGGDILRATLAGRATRRPEGVVWGSLGDRYVDVLALGGLIVLGAVWSRDALPVWGRRFVTVFLAVMVLGLLAALLAAFRVRLARVPKRFRRVAGRSMVALRRMTRTPTAVGAALAMALVIQGGFILVNAWIGRALGIDVPVSVWFVVWPLAKLTALVPVSLNGIGVRDATQGALLAPLGVPMASGVVASLVWQSVLVAGGLLAGAIWWLMSRHGGDAPVRDVLRGLRATQG